MRRLVLNYGTLLIDLQREESQYPDLPEIEPEAENTNICIVTGFTTITQQKFDLPCKYNQAFTVSQHPLYHTVPSFSQTAVSWLDNS